MQRANAFQLQTCLDLDEKGLLTHGERGTRKGSMSLWVCPNCRLLTLRMPGAHSIRGPTEGTFDIGAILYDRVYDIDYNSEASEVIKGANSLYK